MTTDVNVFPRMRGSLVKYVSNIYFRLFCSICFPQNKYKTTPSESVLRSRIAYHTINILKSEQNGGSEYLAQEVS